MTQFTSFVAVEELTITKGGVPVKVNVPVEMPDGVSYEGVFGEQQRAPLVGLAVAGRGFGGGGFGGVPGAASSGRTRFASRGAETFYARSPAPAAPAQMPAAAGQQPQQVGQAQQQHQQLGQQQLGRRLTQQGQSGAVPNAGTKLSLEKKEALAEADTDALQDGAAAEPAPADPLAKLDESLRNLGDRVAKEGKDGTLAAGPVAVTNYRLDVMVYLSDVSPQTLDALKKLGFEQSAESKAVRLVIGTIDVRKLADLAKLEAVVSVKPV